MADLIQIVDSVASSPTVRLDLNNDNPWSTRVFNAPPPRLRRAASQNAMTDGVYVSSSTYDARSLGLQLDLRTASQDTNATEIQKLARELDRTDNYLRYHPTGATKPVFFRLLRSDFSDLLDVKASAAFRKLEIELLAQPFAVGLKELLGPFTINNDPAHASNPMGVVISGVLGDVATPAVVVDTTALRRSVVISTQPGPLVFLQAESMTLGIDTTNIGGGPDALMSGAGTNNFVRTSFATDATFRDRVQAFITTWQPSYRVFAIVRRSDATSVIQARQLFGPIVTVPLTTNRTLLDLGLLGDKTPTPSLLGAKSANLPSNLVLQASRLSGSGTLDWDAVVLLSGERTMAIWDRLSGTDDTNKDVAYDAEGEQVLSAPSGTFFSGTTFDAIQAHAGRLPHLLPNTTQRLMYVVNSGTISFPQHDKTVTSALEVHYWPRYLYIRPSAS